MTPYVLLVDDEPLLREFMGEIVRDSGLEPVEADSADAAHQMLEKDSSVAAVITDVRMPGAWSGVELANWLAETKPDLPVLVLTGYAPNAARRLPSHVKILAKPFPMSELQAFLMGVGGH